MRPDEYIIYYKVTDEVDKLRQAIKLIEQAIDLVDNNDLMEAHYSLIMKLYKMTGDVN